MERDTHDENKKIKQGVRIYLFWVVLLIILMYFVPIAHAYNCPVSGGLPPIPNYLACGGKNPTNIKVCDNMCNCSWVIQCQ